MVDRVKFADVCTVLEQVERTRGSAKKRDVFASFFSSIPVLLTEHAFPLLRLLMPKFDREKTYGISVKKIASLYIDANAWPAQGQKATRLFQWADKKQSTKASGVSNFTNVLQSILRDEGCIQASDWTVADINELLEELKNATSHAERLPIWRKLSLGSFSAMEHKWLMRIILKDMKLGIGDNTILATFHPLAIEWYNVTSDLNLVCTKALEHNVPVSSAPPASEISISADNPIRPMLAARVLWNDIEAQVNNGVWGVELKFDGERCLIHKTDSRFRLFSRNQIELSSRYPDYLTALAPYLNSNIAAQSCIIDGELVVWNDVLGGFASFGMNRAVAAGQIPDCHLAYVAFDIIYLDGKPLVDLPLFERRKILEKCISAETPHRLEIAKQEIIEKPEQIITALDHAVDQGNEGLVIKKTDSEYGLGVRDKNFWMKIKADYLLSDAMCDTLDLVILGVYFGKRNSFLLGVANQDNLDEHGHPRSFYTFLKVGSGFTEDELNMVIERLEPHYRRFEKSSAPPWFEPLPSSFSAPNVAVDPSRSIILEIKGYEIVSTNKQSCGYTVRFPVVVRIRTDKLWYEGWTLGDLLSIVSGPNRGRICYNVREKLSSSSHLAKTSTRPLSSKILTTLNKLGNVAVKSTLFSGLRIHVRGCTSRYSITDMQKLIAEHGGELVLNLTKDNTKTVNLIVAGDKTLQVENLIRMASEDPAFGIDIIRFQWVEDSIADAQQCLFYPWYWMHLSPQTRTRLCPIMDVDTGIVWGQLPNQDTCKRIYSWYRARSPETQHDGPVTGPRGIKRFRQQLGNAKYDQLWTPETLFRDVVAYCFLDCPQSALHGGSCSVAKMIANCIKVYSGRTVNEITLDITHIIVCDVHNFKCQNEIFDLPEENLLSIKIIDHLWLDNCLEKQDRSAVATCDRLYATSLSGLRAPVEQMSSDDLGSPNKLNAN